MKRLRKFFTLPLKLATLLLASLLIAVPPAGVSALSDIDIQSLYGHWEKYVPDDGSCAASLPAGTLPAIIPEPYNGAFTAGAKKYKVAPALIAALFTEENFTNTAPTAPAITARWQNLLKTHPDPNSGWPTNQFHTQGAFQFIPTTWAAYGVDGDGDGKKDPQNIADGAAGAANYVAHNGATADKPPQEWRSAIFAYNHADWYVEAVLQYVQFYSAGGAAAPSVGITTPTSACSGSVGAGNGNIVKTALGLAWPPPPDNSRKVSTPAYIKAVAQYDDNGDQTDCGRFVATVMHMSGVDPEFPNVGTAIMGPYMESHPTKYKRLGPVTSAQMLHPGDILVDAGVHIEFFIGDQGSGINTAGASLHDHTPQQNGPGELGWIINEGGFVAYTPLGGQ